MDAGLELHENINSRPQTKLTLSAIGTHLAGGKVRIETEKVNEKFSLIMTCFIKDQLAFCHGTCH